MELEKILSGYCRDMDQSRMVTVVVEDKCLTEVDCNFGTCPHEGSCLIASQIRDLTNK